MSFEGIKPSSAGDRLSGAAADAGFIGVADVLRIAAESGRILVVRILVQCLYISHDMPHWKAVRSIIFLREATPILVAVETKASLLRA